MKGIVYYTDNRLPEPMFSVVQWQIKKSNLPIVSISLRPVNFGDNHVLEATPSVITMFRQIKKGLEVSEADTIFLCEHDVLYHPSHFDFEPERRMVYYYNTNVWRWKYPEDYFITYDHLASLSGICADRKLLLEHYNKRLELIEQRQLKDGRDPNWARKMGYEPGKQVRRGGFLDEERSEWRSVVPNIDIRHKRTLTPPKVTLDSFRHLPTGWQTATLVPEWPNLRELFQLKDERKVCA